MKFSHNIKLKKDLPDYKKGWPFDWSGSRQRYFPRNVSTWGYNEGQPDISHDYDHQGFTLEQGQDEEWFEQGELTDFYPKFPSKEEINEYVYLEPETRLVDDVDFCRCFNQMINEGSFKDRLYKFYKEEYQKKYDQLN